MRRPRRHHPGQGPAGDGNRPFLGATGNDDVLGPKVLDGAIGLEMNVPLLGDFPDLGLRPVIGGAFPESLQERTALVIVFSEIGPPGGRLLFQRAVYLSAGGRLFVQHDNGEAETGGLDGGGHTGRTGPDDGELTGFSHQASPRPECPNGSRSAAPDWVSMAMS